MTRRQQLFVFVLSLSIVSVLITGTAIAIDMSRQVTVSASMVTAQQQPQVIVVEAAPVAPTDPYGWATPRPTFTPTPPPTETYTPVPTWTPEPTKTPVPIDTPTPVPTDTPVPTSTRPPAPTATPAPPTDTPAPQYAYVANPIIFDTGSAQVTRVTGMVWKIIDVNTNHFDGEPGFQMRLVDPSGQEHLGEISGIGGTDSSCPDCGDNKRMNMKVEFSPYMPGPYKLDLFRDGQQMAATYEFTMSGEPMQTLHVDYLPSNF